MELFSTNQAETIAHLGELKLIKAIQYWLGEATLPAPAGIGDDCAVVKKTSDHDQLLTTDCVVYKRHFDASAPPEVVGEKLIKRNLSDIAAMGGTPGPALLALLAGGDLKTEWLQRFYEGIASCALRYGTRLIGGDICEGEPGGFCATLTLLGEAQKPVLRRAARPGDTLWVTGTLGGSIRGHHLSFEPRLAEGHWLAQTGVAHAMIDITDGLAKDLPTLLSEGTAAFLDLGAIPLSEAAHTLAKESHKTALEHALCDGEDYELCFALDHKANIEHFKKAWENTFSTPLTCIGSVKASKAKNLLMDAATGKPLAAWHGFTWLKEKE